MKQSAAVVTLLFNRTADKILLVRRLNPPFAGCWNGIGGKLLPSEDPIAATIRECLEETGIVLTHPKLLATYLYPGEQLSTNRTLHITYDFVDETFVNDNREGHYAWKPTNFVMDASSTKIAGYSNLNQFVKEIFDLENIKKFYQ